MREWESDPLFAAAEVVQDSADRMESIYRLLLHEQSLIQGDHKDGSLLSSIEYHRRDLATALETAKWQLEDFERELNWLASADKSQVKQNVIPRHLQFIRAIREQISLVERSMYTSLGNSLRNMHLNEQDRDGLAIFLSGEKPIKHTAEKELEDNDILRRFIDPAVSSSSREYCNGGEAGETEVDCSRYDEEGTWDLEASGPEAKTYLQDNKLRYYCGRMNIFGSFGNFLFIHGKRASRSFTKRLKDGEEQRQSPMYRNSQRRIQRYLACLRSAFAVRNFHTSCAQISAQALQSSNWIRDRREKLQRSFRNHPVLFILSLLLILSVLSPLLLVCSLICCRNLIEVEVIFGRYMCVLRNSSIHICRGTLRVCILLKYFTICSSMLGQVFYVSPYSIGLYHLFDCP